MAKETVIINGETYEIREDQQFMVIDGYIGLANLNEDGEFEGWAVGTSVAGGDLEKRFNNIQRSAEILLPPNIAGILVRGLSKKSA